MIQFFSELLASVARTTFVFFVALALIALAVGFFVGLYRVWLLLPPFLQTGWTIALIGLWIGIFILDLFSRHIL